MQLTIFKDFPTPWDRVRLSRIHGSVTRAKRSRNISEIYLQELSGFNLWVWAEGLWEIKAMHVRAESSSRSWSAGLIDRTRPVIFVVEDDADIARLLDHNLNTAGFRVQSFVNSSSVVSEAIREMPALFLLDVMLPGSDGFELCRHIRQTPALSATPVIFLTAKSNEADRVKGLELGGDDYITKPFSPRELVARVRSLLRDRAPADAEVLRLGDLAIDVSSMTVHVHDHTVPTTVREFRLLEYLATHRGRVFTRDQLLHEVWKETSFVTRRSIDVYIRRLRTKIEADPHRPQYLKTIRGIGYRFDAPKSSLDGSDNR